MRRWARRSGATAYRRCLPATRLPASRRPRSTQRSTLKLGPRQFVQSLPVPVWAQTKQRLGWAGQQPHKLSCSEREPTASTRPAALALRHWTPWKKDWKRERSRNRSDVWIRQNSPTTRHQEDPSTRNETHSGGRKPQRSQTSDLSPQRNRTHSVNVNDFS